MKNLLLILLGVAIGFCFGVAPGTHRGAAPITEAKPLSHEVSGELYGSFAQCPFCKRPLIVGGIGSQEQGVRVEI